VREIVRRERDRHAVAEDHADTMLAHATAELRAYDRAGVGLHCELATCVDVGDDAFESNMVITAHSVLLLPGARNMGPSLRCD